MKLQINLDKNDIDIIIKNGRKVVALFSWTDEYTLSEKLLPNIDKLLNKNKIKREQIGEVSAKITKDSGVTSSRIVQTLARTWNSAAGHKIRK
jgi:hypothetical protein